MMRILIVLTLGLGALFSITPLRAQGGLCTAQAAGEESCRQSRLCECQYFSGGILAGGAGEYRWDCGVLRPSCQADASAAATGAAANPDPEADGIRDFVRGILAEDGTLSPAVDLPAAPAPSPTVGSGAAPLYRQARHGLDQVAAMAAAPPAVRLDRWRVGKAPVASAGDRFQQQAAAAERVSRRLEFQIAKLEAGLAAERQKSADLRSRVDTSKASYAALRARVEDLRAGQQSVLDRMTGRTYLTVGALEEAVAMTGLDLRHLLLGEGKGEDGLGGPFIPAGPLNGSDPLSAMENSIAVLGAQMTRWEQLHELLGRLPLAAPLEQYSVTSQFGPRSDPVNGKAALHKGIDLKAPSGTPVLSTAPGRVFFAGWRGRFGRTVEIDHGYGVRTRYAHLRKILVKRGDPVGHRQTIGLVGSSGRSTGPHVHYEIIVGNEQHDPKGFLEAGLHLFKGPGPNDDLTTEVAAE